MWTLPMAWHWLRLRMVLQWMRSSRRLRHHSMLLRTWNPCCNIDWSRSICLIVNMELSRSKLHRGISMDIWIQNLSISFSPITFLTKAYTSLDPKELYSEEPEPGNVTQAIPVSRINSDTCSDVALELEYVQLYSGRSFWWIQLSTENTDLSHFRYL